MKEKFPYSVYLIPVAVFLLFTAVFGLIYFSAPGRLVQDDVFYHMARALAYATGNDFHYPIYSTISSRPVDLHYGFHLLMSLFMRDFNGQNFSTVISHVKLMNSFLAGLLFLVIYLMIFGFSRRDMNISPIKAAGLAGVAVIFLYAVAPILSFRLLLIRPEIISLILFLLAFYFVEKRKSLPLFLICLAYPFFYSFAIIVLIVPGVYLLSVMFYQRNWQLIKKSTLPFFICILGLTIGTFIRPDAFNYIYNAYYVVILTIFAPLLTGSFEATELMPAYLTFVDFLWLVPFSASICLYISKYFITSDLFKAISQSRFFLMMMTVTTFIIYMEVQRGSEYFFPFVVTFIVLTIYDFASSDVKLWISSDVSDENKFIRKLLLPIREIRLLLVEEGKKVKIISVIALVSIFCASTFGLIIWQNLQEPQDKYEGAAKFIFQDSVGQSVVFTQFFDRYPKLVFYNPKPEYITGMAGIYLYLYDSKLYFLWLHIVKGEKICSTKICDANTPSLDLYQTIKDNFKAIYVFIDYSTHNGTQKTDNTKKFVSNLDKDNRFKKVFTDPKYPEVFVYKL